MGDFQSFFKKYKWRIITVSAGIALAILFFSIGFWRTLLLLLIVAVCYVLGSLMDAGGREKIKEAVGVLFKK